MKELWVSETEYALLAKRGILADPRFLDPGWQKGKRHRFFLLRQQEEETMAGVLFWQSGQYLAGGFVRLKADGDVAALADFLRKRTLLALKTDIVLVPPPCIQPVSFASLPPALFLEFWIEQLERAEGMEAGTIVTHPDLVRSAQALDQRILAYPSQAIAQRQRLIGQAHQLQRLLPDADGIRPCQQLRYMKWKGKIFLFPLASCSRWHLSPEALMALAQRCLQESRSSLVMMRASVPERVSVISSFLLRRSLRQIVYPSTG